MKRIALGLLFAAAGLWTLSVWMEGRHPGWGYLGAFAEAAMVGAIADWFAVVALFRHPLGLPIPHTAIIPTNKDRIGEKLATFFCTHFLGTEQVLAKLSEYRPADRLGHWLAKPAHAQELAAQLGAVLGTALRALDDEPVRQFFKRTVVERLGAVDSTRWLGELLDLMTTDGRHQRLLDAALQQLGRVLEDASLKERLADVIAAEVKYLRFVGLDNTAGRYATEKLVAGIGRLLAEMGEDPGHPQRQRFDQFMLQFIAGLKTDEGMRQRGETIKQELLSHPRLSSYLHGLWSQMLDWTRHDLASDASTLRAHVASAAQSVGEQLLKDEAMREWLHQQLMDAAPRWIERHREDFRQYIVNHVKAWDAEQMTTELESHIGRDLQFIRINGTLVGGLVGLSLHTLRHL